jgi:NADH-quinone oxidoreductase subunit D
MNQEHAFALAIEKLLGIEVPERAQVDPRAVRRDRPRVLNHLLNVTTHAHGRRRASRRSLWALRGAREADGCSTRRVCGARLHAELLPARAACAQDLPAGLEDKIAAWAETFPTLRAMTSKALLTDNRIWKQRTVDIGVVTAEQALAWGFTGPMPARLRRRRGTCARRSPTRCYDRDGLRHPDRHATATATTATSCRMEEMRQCVHDHQAVPGQDAQAAGPVHGATTARSRRRARGEMKRSMEALIHHFKLYTEGFHVPAGEAYAAVEAPKGEFGVYLVADGTNKPYRCKIRAPGFAHLQAHGRAWRAATCWPTFRAIIGSLDIVFGEIDR